MTENNELEQAQALSRIRDAYDKLMSRQFFYYNIASQFALKAINKREQLNTMAVAHVDGVHWLMYHPKFINFYDYKDISSILEHEIRHFTDDHVRHFDSSMNVRPIFRTEGEAKEHVRSQKEQALRHRLENIAQDRAINVQLFGLPRIRYDIQDLKAEYTDNKGVFNREEYLECLVKGFSKKQIQFDFIQVDTAPAKFTNAEGDLDVQAYALYLENILDNLPQETVLSNDNINEKSFNSILKEADYQPTDELKRLRSERLELNKQLQEEYKKETPDQSILTQIRKDLKVKAKEFETAQEPELAKVKRYGTWQYFFDLLMSCPKNEDAIKHIRSMDVHFGDESGGADDGRDAQEARDKLIIEAARNSNKHDIPGDLRDHIKALFDKYSKEEALPWNIILRRMVNASKKSIKKNDVNSRNKYAPGEQILPGYRLDPIKDIAVIWDVSGSCMDEDTQTTFIKEVNMMIKTGSNVRVYYTDQDVEHIQDCKGKPMRPAEYQITGGGGTHLDNGIKKAIEDGYKIIIQVTDCYMSYDMSKRDLKGRRIITVSTTDSTTPAHYGPTIKVNRK